MRVHAASAPAEPIESGLIASLRDLDPDGRHLFASRILRMFAYGSLAVVLVLYLASLGLDPFTIGAILTLTLVGDTIISLWLTTNADRIGRRRVLVAGSLLMVIAGVAFALTSWVPLLILAATVGVISPTGNEVGPFLAVEQAALSQATADDRRTCDLRLVQPRRLRRDGARRAGGRNRHPGDARGGFRRDRRLPGDPHRVRGASALGWPQSSPGSARRSKSPPSSSASAGMRLRFGLGRSRGIVARLSALFALDAFGGGFVIQSLIAYWFHVRFGVEPGILGAIFFAANLLAAVSALVGGAHRGADRLDQHDGLHAPAVERAADPRARSCRRCRSPSPCLLLRFSISQMDVPTRQSYVMAVVDPSERSAAAGVTGIARTTGAAISPAISAPLIASAGLAALPFFLAGGLKIVYDLLLYRAFRSAPSAPQGTAPSKSA